MTDRENFEAWFAPLRSQMQNNGLGSTAIERRKELQWSAWQAAISSQNEPGDGWIDWAGGECPVQGNAGVEVRLKDGTVSSAWLAKGWVWEHGVLSPGADIIAYRVVKS